jgi:Na+-driven multidrug efflux pump
MLQLPASHPLLQSLVASNLGKDDRRSAAAVFRRTLTLAVSAGVVICCLLLASRTSLPAVFTPDAAVIREVSSVLPLIALFMPLDAAASVMDGVLLGSQEAGWLGKTMVATSACCAVGLTLSQRFGWPITLIWFVIKASCTAAHWCARMPFCSSGSRAAWVLGNAS